jgi:hypothetical protein
MDLSVVNMLGLYQVYISHIQHVFENSFYIIYKFSCHPRLYKSQSQSQSHIATDGQSVIQSWCRVQSAAYDQVFITV